MANFCLLFVIIYRTDNWNVEISSNMTKVKQFHQAELVAELEIDTEAWAPHHTVLFLQDHKHIDYYWWMSDKNKWKSILEIKF